MTMNFISQSNNILKTIYATMIKKHKLQIEGTCIAYRLSYDRTKKCNIIIIKYDRYWERLTRVAGS